MKNKKLMILLFMLVFAVGVLSSTIVAWLVHSAETDTVEFDIGDVEFTWSGTTKASPIVPGDNLITTPYALSNTSNVLTELRVKVTLTSDLDADATAKVNLVMGNGWVYDGTDQFWYYRGTDTQVVSEDGVTKYKIPTTVTSITVVTGVSLNGQLVGNPYSLKKFNMSFLFQAKQSDHVTWEDLGEAGFDFTQGIVPTP